MHQHASRQRQSGSSQSGSSQSGSFLIEALVSVLIFALAFLGMLALQANAIKASTNANYRAEATFLSNHLIGLLSVADPVTLETFQHRANGAACQPSGEDSTSTVALAWLKDVAERLPGADAARQQVKINKANQVIEISMCWEVPGNGQHQHRVTTQLQIP